eukprot:TRINITY_DN61096_c0_g1_i1.p1 TRINITY_DN61096_c0_g1~~TRINITY_DN61096_c0_g1_i1.p1  ORF type:complete len:386 (+),score=86.54 TRINITY_DN61096_c0_g1_i1:29-1159(+)
MSSDVAHHGAELRPPRRPTLLGSPMRTPLASPAIGPSAGTPPLRERLPSLNLDEEDAAAIQAAIEASLGDDMKRRLQSSLQSTEQELKSEYLAPEGAGTPLMKRARVRSASELEEAVAPHASPLQMPTATPPLEATDQDAGYTMPAVCLPPSPLEFDGLLDHQMLLESIYAAQGVDLLAQQDKAAQLLAEVGLKALDLGVKNWDEEGRELLNQCFYLSIARSYLGHHVEPEEVQKVALTLKRTVEVCVLAAHPDWAKDDSRLGENAMAFADFLPSAMGAKDPPNLLSRLAVVIMDTTQCSAEAYLGPHYLHLEASEEARPREELEKNLILLCYTPGHYKALVQDDSSGSKPAWTYPELKGLFDQRGVFCIETSDFD